MDLALYGSCLVWPLRAGGWRCCRGCCRPGRLSRPGLRWWRSAASWWLACRVADGCDQEIQVPVVRAGDGVGEGDERAGGDGGGELEDAPFAAADGQLPVMRGAERGVPVDPGHHGGAVADAGPGVREGGEVVAVHDAAVADEQLGAGFIGVQAGGVSAQRGVKGGAHRARSGPGAASAAWLAGWSRMRWRAPCLPGP